MRIKYPKAIQESEEDLTKLEQHLRGQKAADRVRMLRLLKSGAVKSLKDCAPLVGYSVTQLTRWWECYRAAGLAELLKQHKPVGQTSKLTAEAWEGLMVAMRAGHIVTMRSGARLSGARVGHPLQERQVALVALQETSGQVEDRAQATEESQYRATGRL
jgi:transposase-like protein